MRYGNYTPMQKLVRSPLMMIVAIVLFVILSKAVWNIHEKANASKARLDQATAELNRLKTRQDEVSTKVAYLSTDQGVESELRTKYLAVKEGEQVAVIVNQTDGTTSTSTEVVKQDDGWFTKVLQWFGF